MSKAKEKSTSGKWVISIRTLALAQPNKNRISKKFDPNAPTPLSSVSRAALKAKATARLLCLAEPAPAKKSKKFDQSKVVEKRLVSRAALRAQCSSRSDHLARNIQWKVQETLKNYNDRGDFLVNRLQRRFELSQACMYREMYWPKPPPPPPPPPKMLSIMYKKGWKPPPPKSAAEMQAEMDEWCAANCTPKPNPPPPEEPKKNVRPLSYLRIRLKNMANPRLPITEKLSNRPPQPTGLKPATLKHVTTEREKKLSVPKPIQNPENNPEGVNPEALTYKITPRMKALGQPKVRALAGDGDLKENPFGVVPMALKAWCSPRTKELAKPKGVK